MGSRTRALIADRGNDVFVSIVSLWEIVLKAEQLKANIPAVLDAVESVGFTLLDLSVHHLTRQHELAASFGDPFDPLLIAQADCEGLTFVTADSQILSTATVDLIECGTGKRHRRRHGR